MSKKLWLGLITVFVIFVILQVISNIHKRGLDETQSNAPEIIVDLSTLNASSIAQELEKKEINIAKRQEPVKPAAAAGTGSGLPKSMQDVQKALKAAGFNPGKIDGKLGEKTKSAIRSFQKAHDLKVDGKVGTNTWRLLKRYLQD